MTRLNAYQSILQNAYSLPVNIFANEKVKIEQNAISELTELLDLQQTIAQIQAVDKDFFASQNVGIEQVAVTPDFHKGAGIPIGTTLLTKGFLSPQAIGKDINCGMRMYVTDLSETEIRAHLPSLSQKIRHTFFQGGRNLPLTKNQKTALLQNGLMGLLETWQETENEGLWRQYDAKQQENELSHVINMGSMTTNGIFSGLENYVKAGGEKCFDSQIGSIGGGNHFVEVQRVKEISNGAIAHEWGLKVGQTVVMIHTGSVSIGYPTAIYFQDILRKIYPKQLKLPKNGILPLPFSEKYAHYWAEFWQALSNATNFAFGNRLFLGLMLKNVMESEFGSHTFDLLYDSGHNLVWQENLKTENVFLHRKGACPARGAEQMQNTPFHWTGEPVLIPGSMGASSFILAGNGNANSNFSASHGAGRSLSRGESLKYDEKSLDDFLKNFHIITPIDPKRADIRSRQDILQKWRDEIKKEAPFAFKPISAVIETQVQAGIANVVAEVEPIFTIKG